MRHKPTNDYSGLTLVLDNPSRFDQTNGRLLSATAGDIVERCLSNRFTLASCDVRLKESLHEGFLDGTTCVLLMGARCLPRAGVDFALGECRGSLLNSNYPHQTIATYLPQDALDPTDHEGKLNKLANKYDEHEEDKTNDEKSSHGKTSRQNWLFWFESDIRKAARIAMEGPSIQAVDSTGFKLYPSSAEILDSLRGIRDQELFLDIETDSGGNITCIGYAINDGPIYVVPFIRFNYQLAYGAEIFCKIYQAMAVAIGRNMVVAHNSMFDLFALSYKYKIPVGPMVYDTMLAHHRCFPEVEKSLGHCVAYWLDEAYHKNDGVFMPNNERQERELWIYNAKDIATTRGVKRQIDRYAMTISGLPQSIAQANSMVRPYLINTLYGIRYSQKALEEIRHTNARRMTQYLRILKVLTGKEKFNPNSNVDVPRYFYTELGYDVIKKSAKTGNASAGAGELYKMKLKYPDNAVIDCIMAFRKLKKENGQLKFTPHWSTKVEEIEL